MAVWSVGCSGAGDEPTVPAAEPEQGVVLGLRTPAGEPAAGVQGYLGGGDRAVPDAAGFVYYVGVVPGRIQVSVYGDAYAVAHGAPQVQPGGLAFASVVPLPIEVAPVEGGAAHSVVGDGFTVEIPADSALFDEAPAVGPWSIGQARIGDADRPSLPGDLVGQRNDTDLAPMVIDEAFVVRGWNDLGEVSFAEDTLVGYTLDLPSGSPLLEPAAEPQLYVYSGSQTRWVYAGTPVIDAGARTATWDSRSVGWWAVARPAEPAERSCVGGRFVDGAGLPISGAQVRLTETGTLGVDRISTDGGAFCLPIGVGAAALLAVVGVDATRETLFTWNGQVTGGAAGDCASDTCVDLGDVPARVWTDADGDRSWAGPGGDCDDTDAGVNPNPTLGDGTYCGDRL